MSVVLSIYQTLPIEEKFKWLSAPSKFFGPAPCQINGEKYDASLRKRERQGHPCV